VTYSVGGAHPTKQGILIPASRLAVAVCLWSGSRGSWSTGWRIEISIADGALHLRKGYVRLVNQAFAVRLNSRRRARKPVMPMPRRAIELGSGTASVMPRVVPLIEAPALPNNALKLTPTSS